MSLPSRLPYSSLLLFDCDGADMLSEDVGRDELADGRPAAGLLAGRRAAGRDRVAVDLGRDEVDLVRDEVDLELEPEVVDVSGFAALDVVLRDLVEVFRVVPEVDLFAAGLRAAVVRDAVVRDVVVREVARRAGAAVGVIFAVDIFLAASVRALAACIMALVAVFIDCMADDIVFAEAVALVAADVILVAAEVTLVAADDTFLAAVAGVAAPRLAVVRLAVVRRAVPRLAVLRLAVVRRAAVERDVVERDVDLPVDREAVLRADGVVDRADLVVLRDLDAALDDLELELGFDRLAVPLDALRLTDLLRAVLAELRRAAARVVD
jgi:hypothetical protein